jgi:hypothetical protein
MVQANACLTARGRTRLAMAIERKVNFVTEIDGKITLSCVTVRTALFRLRSPVDTSRCAGLGDLDR